MATTLPSQEGIQVFFLKPGLSHFHEQAKLGLWWRKFYTIIYKCTPTLDHNFSIAYSHFWRSYNQNFKKS